MRFCSGFCLFVRAPVLWLAPCCKPMEKALFDIVFLPSRWTLSSLQAEQQLHNNILVIGKAECAGWHSWIYNSVLTADVSEILGHVLVWRVTLSFVCHTSSLRWCLLAIMSIWGSVLCCTVAIEWVQSGVWPRHMQVARNHLTNKSLSKLIFFFLHLGHLITPKRVISRAILSHLIRFVTAFNETPITLIHTPYFTCFLLNRERNKITRRQIIDYGFYFHALQVWMGPSVALFQMKKIGCWAVWA